MPSPTALIRSVPGCFDRALVREGRPTIDVEMAQAQHETYRRHLEAAGYAVEIVAAHEAHPDCVFIEDTAVVIGEAALITRPGASERRGETDAVAEALSSYFPLTRMTAPGTLDGGDVFMTMGTVFVGRSDRTNDDGIKQLGVVAADQGMRLVVVGVYGALHLKSAVIPIDPETVVVTPDAVEEQALAGLHIVYEATEERHRFSALPIRDGRLLVTDNAPVTSARIAALGHETVPMDVSQIQAADGGLTCMSILF